MKEEWITLNILKVLINKRFLLLSQYASRAERVLINDTSIFMCWNVHDWYSKTFDRASIKIRDKYDIRSTWSNMITTNKNK